MSVRLLLTVILGHLRDGRRHAEGCTDRRCVPGCGYRGLDEWLDGPVTRTDEQADAVKNRRLEALLRGGIV